ncbi:hypothetical protein ACOSP6_11150 [Tenacibaculum sp. MEBiC06402]|uniref:hypothetical protein n=1 Tax=unclassified Tenacibaculum TaxID=2635139 RepID=UPI003B991243
MEKIHIEKALNNLENYSEEEAYFSIISDMDDNIHIEANKLGVIQYAKELLLNSRQFDYLESQPESERFIRIENKDWLFIEDYNYFPVIKAVYGSRNELTIDKKTEEYKETFTEKLFKYGCVLIFVFLLISILIGIYQIVSWIVN